MCRRSISTKWRWASPCASSSRPSPAARRPSLAGHVTVLSADALTDNRTQTSYYRAEIMLDPGETAKLEERNLVPGMPVEAFIRTGERSPLAYLLKPFTDYFNRALRET